MVGNGLADQKYAAAHNAMSVIASMDGTVTGDFCPETALTGLLLVSFGILRNDNPGLFAARPQMDFRPEPTGVV
jgi:hypothetical protein